MVETVAKASPDNIVTTGMLTQRLDGMDKAIELLQELADRQPSALLIQQEVAALKELTAANFKALRELTEAKFEGNKTALDAALKTQKEGSDKIESNFTKQIDNVQNNISVLTKTTDDKLGELKDRYNTSAGQSTGSGAANASNRAMLFSVIGVLVGVGALVLAIISRLG